MTLSCRSQHQEVSFSTRATEGMGETGRKLRWWLVAAKFCVKQKQFPEVAVQAVALPGKGRHGSKPQPAPAGLHPEPCRARWIRPGDRDPHGEQLWGLSQGMLCSLLCFIPRSRGLWAANAFGCHGGLLGMELCPRSCFSQHPKCASPLERVAKAPRTSPGDGSGPAASLSCVQVAPLALPSSLLGSQDRLDAGSEGFIPPGFRPASVGKMKQMKVFSL